jgi:polyisoprenoid-binding protein YceI
MNKKAEFEKELIEHIDNYTKKVVLNRNPVSINFHKADLYSNVLRSFYKALNYEVEYDPKQKEEELIQAAILLKRINRKMHKRKKKVRLKSL